MAGWKEKAAEIADGWKNLMVMDEVVEETAAKRAEVCAKCPEYGKKLGIPVCNNCGCPLAAKTRSTLGTCPLGKW